MANLNSFVFWLEVSTEKKNLIYFLALMDFKAALKSFAEAWALAQVQNLNGDRPLAELITPTSSATLLTEILPKLSASSSQVCCIIITENFKLSVPFRICLNKKYIKNVERV